MIVFRSSCARQSGPSLQISLVAQAEHAAPIMPAHGSPVDLRAIHCKIPRDSGLDGGMSKSPFMSVQKRSSILVSSQRTDGLQ
jgi:hypothetical protein